MIASKLCSKITKKRIPGSRNDEVVKEKVGDIFKRGN